MDIAVGILAGDIVGIAVQAFAVDYIQVGQVADHRGKEHIAVADTADQCAGSLLA